MMKCGVGEVGEARIRKRWRESWLVSQAWIFHAISEWRFH
jgi:hypothetical protein